MSFAADEISTENGAPLYLYDFVYSGKAWYLTNNVRPLRHANNDYVPTMIKHNTPDNSGDFLKSSCTITVAYDSEIGMLFREQPPSEMVNVRVFVAHEDPSTDTVTPMVVWMGHVSNVAWKGVTCDLTTDSAFKALSRLGVVRKFSRPCTHTLYSKPCGVDIKTHEFQSVVTAINGTKVTLSNPDADAMAGGIIRYKNARTEVIERRSILDADATSITLSVQPSALEVGATVTLVHGCPHTIDVCRARFNNTDNYGGQPYVPPKNPFGNNPIW